MEGDEAAAGVVYVLVVLLQSVVQTSLALLLLHCPAVLVRQVHRPGPLGLLCRRDRDRGSVNDTVGHDLPDMTEGWVTVGDRMFPEVDWFTKIDTSNIDILFPSVNISVTQFQQADQVCN